MTGSPLLLSTLALLAVLSAAAPPPPPPTTTSSVDLLVYGGTPGGVMAACAAAAAAASPSSSSPPLSILLLDPLGRVGGMSSSGLGNSDVGNASVVGGFPRRLFLDNARVYNATADAPLYLLEPSVALSLFTNWLADANVTVLSGPGVRLASVQVTNASFASSSSSAPQRRVLTGLVTEDGRAFSARVFVDASYEGDLLAAAGVPFAVGREGIEQYGEAVAGRLSDNYTYTLPIDPYNHATTPPTLLPLMSTAPFGNVGEADGLVQSYNFRLCATNVSSNRVPFPAPQWRRRQQQRQAVPSTQDDPSRFELFRRWVAAMPPDLSSFFGYARRIPWLRGPPSGPCCKFDLNSDFAVSTDFVGGAQEWPAANATTRAEIWDAHKEYTLSLLDILQNDPTTPARVRAEAAEWGLCADEFQDTGSWPPQLYVREARRMVGARVFTLQDVRNGSTADGDSVGLGSYSLDVHHVQRVPCLALQTADPLPQPFSDPPHPVVCTAFQPTAAWPGPNATVWVAQEGHMGGNGAPGGVYEIPYSALLPARGDAANLLVPVALSASHAAFSTVRLEPTWMILGEASGVAASLALGGGLDVQDVPVPALQSLLRAQGAYVTRGDVPTRRNG
jgi:hypothetical protein